MAANLDGNIVDIPHDCSARRVNSHAPNAEVIDRERLSVNGIFGHVCFWVSVSASEGSVGVKMRFLAEGGGGYHTFLCTSHRQEEKRRSSNIGYSTSSYCNGFPQGRAQG